MDELKDLREKYKKDSTYYKEVTLLINRKKLLKDSDEKEILLRKLRDELIRLKKIHTENQEEQSASINEMENYMSLNDMRTIWYKMPESVNKLILGFYIFYEPLRSDWCSARVSGDFFVFDIIHKKKDIDDYRLPIIDELKPLIDYMNQVPTIPNTFCVRLIDISQRIFKKRIGVNMFRKIWIFEYQGRSRRDRRTLSDKMMHSLNTQELYYTKLDMNKLSIKDDKDVLPNMNKLSIKDDENVLPNLKLPSTSKLRFPRKT